MRWEHFLKSYIWFFNINGAQSLLFTNVLQKLHVTWKLSCLTVAMDTVNTSLWVILLSQFNSLGSAIDKLDLGKRLDIPRSSSKFSYWHTSSKQNTVSFSDWLQPISNYYNIFQVLEKALIFPEFRWCSLHFSVIYIGCRNKF